MPSVPVGIDTTVAVRTLWGLFGLRHTSCVHRMDLVKRLCPSCC